MHASLWLLAILGCLHQGEVSHRAGAARLVQRVAEGGSVLRISPDHTFGMQSSAWGLPEAPCFGNWRITQGEFEMQFDSAGRCDGAEPPWHHFAYIELPGGPYLVLDRDLDLLCSPGHVSGEPGWKVLDGSIGVAPTTLLEACAK
jgi:hypothetical protein